MLPGRGIEMKRRIGILMITAAIACFAVAAQDKKAETKKKSVAAAADAGMPKPGPEMKELRGFLGTWTTDETYEKSPMMPEGGTGTGTNTVRQGPGGFSLLMDQHSKMGPVSFSGHGVLTYDPNEKVYKMLWVDNMTPGAVVSIGHKEGDKLVYTGEVMMGGKKMKAKDVISDRTPTSYILTSYLDDGSGEKKTMTSKVTKQETAAPAKK
jgi:hypothetical protein